MNLIERIEATQKTVDAFKGKSFADGKHDCAQLVVCHAKHMGTRLKVPRYGDLKSAAEALRKMGFATLGAVMDKHFTRIEPVRAMASDIIEMPGLNGFSALSVSVGNGRVLGFHESIPHCDILQPILVSAAWRIGD